MEGGKVILFSAPSGSGKSTIIAEVMKHAEWNLHFSISATSRPPRGSEQDGVEYFFLSPEAFREKIEAGEFLEYEEVYHDRYYGTLKSQVDRQLAAGENVVCDVDVLGGQNIKRHYGQRALSLTRDLVFPWRSSVAGWKAGERTRRRSSTSASQGRNMN